ncbi:MAG: TetR/AcrR family transcriptional regulator [Sulfitobacter sp.]|jgi:TetR/AcrR family transcriptional regulator
MSDTPTRKRKTRIQKRNSDAILEAALDIFSKQGFRGATLDEIAEAAGLSKPNLLYYFDSKEAIHAEVLDGLMDTWLDPLRLLDPEGDPKAQLLQYLRRKLKMSRDLPRESRLFANEILQGAPRIGAGLSGDLKTLVDAKAEVIRGWSDTGKIAQVDPYHLIISIWALTQHYADFEVQVRAVLGGVDPYEGAEAFLEGLYEKLLTP